MGKSSPKAPTPPDPYATAQAQSTMNKETAVANANLNRINQYTPEGSLVYSQIGTNADGTPQYQQTQTYSPGQQAVYDSQNQVSQALSKTALNATGRAEAAMATPWDTSGFTPLQTGIQGAGQGIQQGYNTAGSQQYGFDKGGDVTSGYNAGGNIQQNYASGGNVADNYASGGDIARSFANGGDVLKDYASGGQVQKGLDYSSLDKLAGQGDYGAEAKRVSDALYGQATSRLDPQVEAQQRQLASTLAAKGVSENSVAYRNAMDQFSRQRADAYNQANYSAIGAGGAEQSRLFGLSLAGRQQGVGEINTQGAFANSAQAQQEAQNAARAQFSNQGQAQSFGQNQAMAQFGNEAQAQAEAQNAARAQFGNTAQNQVETQNQARAAFGNTAQAQQNQQNQQAAQFGNEAQNQRYTQNQGLADYYNNAQSTQNQQNSQQAAFGNTAQGQMYNQNAANANFNNTARQQQASEAAYARSLPINEIASLMSGAGQVQGPNFQPYNATNVANTDYSSLVQNNYNNQQQQYQQQMAQRNAGLGSLFGLAGSALKMLPFSDSRLKHSIKAVGKTASGINTYVFSYLGSRLREFGVMADEVFKVLPEAVGSRDGYMTVDYGKVWANVAR